MRTRKKAIPNFVMATTLTSTSSCRTPALTISFGARSCRASSCGCRLSAMVQRFLQMRILDREQRSARHLPCEGSEPDAAEADGRQKIHPTHTESASAEIRRHEPEQVHQPHNDDP